MLEFFIKNATHYKGSHFNNMYSYMRYTICNFIIYRQENSQLSCIYADNSVKININNNCICLNNIKMKSIIENDFKLFFNLESLSNISNNKFNIIKTIKIDNFYLV